MTSMDEMLYSKQCQQFEYNEKKQKVTEIEIMIADFRRLANDLDQQIKLEQQASGITDANHFAYPPFARAAMTRRDNLRASIAELEKRLELAKRELAEAQEQLKIAGAGATGLDAQRPAKPGLRRKHHRGLGSMASSR